MPVDPAGVCSPTNLCLTVGAWGTFAVRAGSPGKRHLSSSPTGASSGERNCSSRREGRPLLLSSPQLVRAPFSGLGCFSSAAVCRNGIRDRAACVDRRARPVCVLGTQARQGHGRPRCPSGQDPTPPCVVPTWPPGCGGTSQVPRAGRGQERLLPFHQHGRDRTGNQPPRRGPSCPADTVFHAWKYLREKSNKVVN